MRSINWAAVKTVSNEEGVYVKEAIRTFNAAIPRIRNALPPSYYQGYCLRLATDSLDLLLDTIWKLKRINQTGAGQLLLDLNAYKEYLLRMPNARLEAGKEPLTVSNPYKGLVNSRIQHIQTILKLVCTDDNNLEEMFALLWPDGKPSDLQAIAALKDKGGLLDPVGDKLKEGATKIGTTVIGHKAVGEIKSGLGDIKSGFKSGFGGFKNAFGDIKAAFAGDLFEDKSGHGNSSSHGYSSSHGPTAAGGSQSHDSRKVNPNQPHTNNTGGGANSGVPPRPK